jgi:hypothetical protein
VNDELEAYFIKQLGAPSHLSQSGIDHSGGEYSPIAYDQKYISHQRRNVIEKNTPFG